MTGLTQDEFAAAWERIDADAQAAKFSQEAILRLVAYYRALDEDDRGTVDAVLAGWILHGDSRRRYDALALVDEFHVKTALPAVRAHLDGLQSATGPSAPFDRAKLERIIVHLSS